VTQRQFVNAYRRGEVDSGELTTALRRYDDLDSDGKQEFDDLMARSGDDAAKLAARTDSDTFETSCLSGVALAGRVLVVSDPSLTGPIIR
jgi:hypothetical protein